MRRSLPVSLVAAPAVAAQAARGHYVWVPNGAAVVLLPADADRAGRFPVARMIAQQEAMKRARSPTSNSLMMTANADPEQMIRSVMRGCRG